MKSWYSITNKSDSLAEISIYEEIGFWGVTAKQFLDDLKQVGDRRIVLRINSPGGEVFDGVAIMSRLRDHKPGVEVRIDGLAASMASVIAMVGAPVKIAENAFIMIHNPAGVAIGEAEDLRETANLLDKVKASLVGSYERKTGLSAKKIEQMMDAETWLNATEAKQLGFVDEITAPVKLAARFDTRKFRHTPNAIAQPMKFLTASIAALLATATGATITEESSEADIKAALDSLSGKVTLAEGKLTPLSTQVADLTTERDQVKNQFAELEKTANQIKADLGTKTTEVTNLTAERDQLKNKLETEKTNVTRLEALCRLRGIDPNKAAENLGDEPPGDTREQLVAKLNKATDPLERGRIANQLRALDTKK